MSDEVAFMHMHIYYLRLRYTHCSVVVTIYSMHTTYPVSSYNTQYVHYIPGLQLQYAVCTLHTRSPVTIRSIHTTYPVSSYNTQYAYYIPGLQLQYTVCTLHTRSPVRIRSMHTTYPVYFSIGLVRKVMPYLNKP